MAAVCGARAGCCCLHAHPSRWPLGLGMKASSLKAWKTAEAPGHPKCPHGLRISAAVAAAAGVKAEWGQRLLRHPLPPAQQSQAEASGGQRRGCCFALSEFTNLPTASSVVASAATSKVLILASGGGIHRLGVWDQVPAMVAGWRAPPPPVHLRACSRLSSRHCLVLLIRQAMGGGIHVLSTAPALGSPDVAASRSGTHDSKQRMVRPAQLSSSLCTPLSVHFYVLHRYTAVMKRGDAEGIDLHALRSVSAWMQ